MQTSQSIAWSDYITRGHEYPEIYHTFVQRVRRRVYWQGQDAILEAANEALCQWLEMDTSQRDCPIEIERIADRVSQGFKRQVLRTRALRQSEAFVLHCTEGSTTEMETPLARPIALATALLARVRATLSADHRVLLYCRYGVGLSVEETAAAAEVTIDQVKGRCKTARQHLQRCFEATFPAHKDWDDAERAAFALFCSRWHEVLDAAQLKALRLEHHFD